MVVRTGVLVLPRGWHRHTASAGWRPRGRVATVSTAEGGVSSVRCGVVREDRFLYRMRLGMSAWRLRGVVHEDRALSRLPNGVRETRLRGLVRGV